MKCSFLFLASAIAALFFVAPHSIDAQKRRAARTIEGTISRYECGDNCYLTITDTKGKEHAGLCTAHPLCTKWNENVEMPDSYKGKRVRVTVGRGTQYNGSGDVMGHMDAFTKIQLLTTPARSSAQPAATQPSCDGYNFGKHNIIKTFINDLARAVSNDDKINLAKMITFPFRDEWGDNPNNESEPLGCKTVDQFFEKYDKIFTIDIIKAIGAKKYRGWQYDELEGDVIKKGEYLIECFDFQSEGIAENRMCNMLGIRKINGKFKIYAVKFYS